MIRQLTIAVAALAASCVLIPSAASAAGKSSAANKSVANKSVANKSVANKSVAGKSAAAGKSKTKATTVALASSSIAAPAFTTDPAVERTGTSCAVDVAPYVARLSVGVDDTVAFTAAMSDAVVAHPTCFAQGPSGAAQAVVYVPAGTYRLAGLVFPSNVRMEVDAGATLQLPANRPAVPIDHGTPMIVWDNVRAGQPAVRNVTLIGVGASMDARKSDAVAQGGVAIASFDVSHDFTMNLDPATTGSTNYNPGMSLANVQNFLIQNVFSIQNGTNEVGAAVITPWPTSARAVLDVHARKDSPIGAGPYLQPKYGTVSDQVNVGSPRGYGPNQVNGAEYVTFQNIYSSGGTALRLETDGSSNGGGIPDRGATINHLLARNIVGTNCNRAVSLSPHAQVNSNVDISDVWAYSCNQGVVASLDKTIPATLVGRFDNASVRNVHVLGGYSAQLDGVTSLWEVGMSQTAVRIVPDLTWAPLIGVTETAGAFAKP